MLKLEKVIDKHKTLLYSKYNRYDNISRNFWISAKADKNYDINNYIKIVHTKFGDNIAYRIINKRD